MLGFRSIGLFVVSGRIVQVLGLTVALAVLSSQVLAAPKSELWDRWTQHDPESTQSLDHSAWDDLLKRYVLTHENRVSRLDYARFSEADQAQLDSYISMLAATTISSFNRNQQRAYWINLYNALIVKVILKHYPVDTILDISPRWFSRGPWREKMISVEKEELSLDDIEHRILRPVWKDPRVHYAVNCAAIGCPNLQAKAFTANNTDSMLDQAASDFINHTRGSHVLSGRLHVSSIYHWFKEDFGGNDEGVIAHLRRYAAPELLALLNDRNRINDHQYDWTINNPDAPEPVIGISRRRGS